MSKSLPYFSLICAIAYRDIIKYARDRSRLILSMFLPVILIGVLGGSIQASLDESVIGYNFLTFVLVGVLAQTIFQTVAQGVISLIDDREKSLTQEFYVAPIPRWSVIIGKIIGESGVGFLQGIFIILFGLTIGVSITWIQFFLLLLTMVVVAIFGGSFGIFIVSFVGTNKESANRIFQLIIFPQFFLAGLFSPINNLPGILLVISRIIPLTYAVDFMRTVFYYGTDVSSKTVVFSPQFDLFIIAFYSWIFIVFGTFFLTRHERNR